MHLEMLSCCIIQQGGLEDRFVSCSASGVVEVAGIAEDLYASSRVDCWWSGGDLTIVRGWK